MSAACSDGHDNPAVRRIAPGAAGWLRLAATPTFAAMALLTGLDGQPDMLCGAMHMSSLSGIVGGMAPMYGLMAAFHAGPWLQLLAGRKRVLEEGQTRV